MVQVSSTATHQKIQSSLEKDLSLYSGYKFIFVSISKSAGSLKNRDYKNPYSLIFDPSHDIHDVSSFLDTIQHFDLAKQQNIYKFLKSELGSSDENLVLQETNLASIVNIISKENLTSISNKSMKTPFNVDDKLTFNNLKTAIEIIEEYKIYHSRLESIYTTFDISGQNKSKSVLDSLRNSYIKLKYQYISDELFFKLVEQTIDRVQQSLNYTQIPLEELELCVNIIIVDAFIKCRIFESPAVISNATT